MGAFNDSVALERHLVAFRARQSTFWVHPDHEFAGFSSMSHTGIHHVAVLQSKGGVSDNNFV
jgi:hypothetical protein